MIHLNRTPILLAALASVLLQFGCGGGGGGGVSAPTTSPTPTVATFTVGGTVSGMFGSGLVLQNNAGDDSTVDANGSFSFATKLPAGTAYVVSIKTQPKLPAQTCTLAGGGGSLAASDVASVAVTCSALALSAPKFVYVANAADPSITPFTINATTGALTAIPQVGTEFQLPGAVPVSLSIDPSNRFMYAADYNAAAGTVRAFTLNATTGKYTAVSGGNYPTGGRLTGSVATDPTGKYVYAANQQDAAGNPTGSISAFAVNPSTGALTAVPGSPFTGVSTPLQVAVDPKGKYVYVTNSGGTSVSSFAINTATGALTPIAGSPFAYGSSPTGLAVDPAGRGLSITGQGFATFQDYAINPANGALIRGLINGPGFATGISIAYEPTGRFAYVANATANTVTPMTFNAAGTLQSAGAPVSVGASPTEVVADPSGKFVFVTSAPPGTPPGAVRGVVTGFSINPTTGALTALPGAATPAGLVARAIVVSR